MSYITAPTPSTISCPWPTWYLDLTVIFEGEGSHLWGYNCQFPPLASTSNPSLSFRTSQPLPILHSTETIPCLLLLDIKLWVNGRSIRCEEERQVCVCVCIHCRHAIWTDFILLPCRGRRLLGGRPSLCLRMVWLSLLFLFQVTHTTELLTKSLSEGWVSCFLRRAATQG